MEKPNIFLLFIFSILIVIISRSDYIHFLFEHSASFIYKFNDGNLSNFRNSINNIKGIEKYNLQAAEKNQSIQKKIENTCQEHIQGRTKKN